MSRPIEFKAGNLSAVTAYVRDLDTVKLADAVHAMLGGTGDFFSGEPAVIDLAQLKNAPSRIDWAGLSSLLRRHGLQPVALRSVPEELQESARKAGFALLDAHQASKQEAPVTAATTAPAPEQTQTAAPAAATMVIDRTVRSGQQVYARGADLVILGGVSNGAEVIADGSIHCYGPLRGRALAGAQGNTQARLYCTNFGPELVSVAGVFRTFERGIAANIAGRAALVRLVESGSTPALSIEPMNLD